MLLKSAYKNILETSTVSLSAGTEDSNYPLYRLYDRDIGKVFKTTAAVTTEVKVDQGATGNLAVDRLLIPAGHNLDGMTLDLKYSDNDADYYTAVDQWVQSGNGLIEVSFASCTHRYWKFIITSPASIPQIAELFLTQTYTWERNPSRPVGPFDNEHNVERGQTAGGQARFLIHGDPKRQRVYFMPRCGETQKTNILALNAAWQGAKPFWLCDHDGTWIFGELRRPLEMKEEAYQSYSFQFDFVEVLP